MSAPTDTLLPAPLLKSLAANWWLLLLRGLASILFGVLAFLWPGPTVLTLTLLWGAYALVDGVVALWAAISGRGGQVAPRWWLAVVGVAGVLAGIIAFFSPGITVLALLMYLAIWSIVTGALQVIGAIRLRREIEGEFWLGLSGVLAILFGIVLISRPGVGLLSVIWVIATFAVLMGIAQVLLAFRLRKHRD